MSGSEREIGATFDIHIVRHNRVGHVMTIHQGRKDEGPLHLISEGRLARLEEIEAMMERMMGEPLDADHPR